jgi:glycosyltransferase involved in cell wall biosynthesis
VEALSIVSILYLSVLALLGMWGLHRSWMVLCLRRAKRASPDAQEGSPTPFVTVQLPLFNERTVAVRVIRAVGALDWPVDRLEIQVLDDSTDETRALVETELSELVRRGVDASVLRRTNRRGYKAGALAQGLALAKGEFVCVFDADFVPPRGFLRHVVPSFADPRVAMVQARWEHANRDESALTRAQATLLDGHFVVEHQVRFASGLFFNFNGTAGVWRRTAIEQAGGWQHDTLTEDLDLSYRVQLAGWRFVYLPLVVAPAELPGDIAAFKSQQHRWAKGSVQVARKLLVRIARADVPWRVKLEAAAHLTGNAGYPLVLALAVLLPLRAMERPNAAAAWHALAFVLCTISVIAFYDAGQRTLGRRLRDRLFDVPAAMALGIGMCVSQTRAVFEGWRRSTGEFVRTPKSGDSPRARHYRAVLREWPGSELVLAGWLGLGLARAAQGGQWGALPFLALFWVGFTWVGWLSLCTGVRAARHAEPGLELAPGASASGVTPPRS